MPVTVVKCSLAGCNQPASSKIAAPWKDSRFRELKTYGYACEAHAPAVVEYASHRPRPAAFEPGETIGPIGSYTIGQASH